MLIAILIRYRFLLKQEHFVWVVVRCARIGCSQWRIKFLSIGGRNNEHHLFWRWRLHSIKLWIWCKSECTGKEYHHSWDRSFGENMYCIGFSPDGNCKAASDDRNIRVWWDAEGGVVIKGPLTGRSGSILFISSSPDSQFFVSTTSYEIIIWDVGSREKKYELLEGHFFRSIGFSSSSKTFVAGDQL